MDVKKLMSGIGVVIDDAFAKEGSAGYSDRIFRLVEEIEKEWNIPFYTNHEIPSKDICLNLLRSASFVLLDWNLWSNKVGEVGVAEELRKRFIDKNISFLEQARNYFTPVFIFTNENPEDVKNDLLSCGLYSQDSGKNFIFVRKKRGLTTSNLFSSIESWVKKNTSVYTLKSWEQEFFAAKGGLFSSLYTKNPTWPRVFWSSYKADDADPSSSIVSLINDNMNGRMKSDILKAEILGKRSHKIDRSDITSVLEGASFIPEKNLSKNEIRSGDIFERNSRKYLLNIRPDCDCIPRDGQRIDRVSLYCIEGDVMDSKTVKKAYDKELGNFNERIWEAIVFMVAGEKTIRFRLKKIVQKRFSELKSKRVGRLTHPYITRIQQRYALYNQRLGLPRIPNKAIPKD